MIYSSRKLLVVMVMLASQIMGESDYLTFFSAEREDFRRVMIDGVGTRRVDVNLDTLGHAEIRIWGVKEQQYIGRRHYKSGFLIPVDIRVDFPSRKYMSIHVRGNQFSEIIRYKVVSSDVYVIDLYSNPLPQESVFHEQTVNALWPAGRFQPDIGPAAVEIEGRNSTLQKLKAAAISRSKAPLKVVVQKAVVWAGIAWILLVVSGFYFYRWYVKNMDRDVSEDMDRSVDLPRGTRVIIHRLMEQNTGMSYDEAVLMTSFKTNGPALRPH